jgi:hypothetical protein
MHHHSHMLIIMMMHHLRLAIRKCGVLLRDRSMSGVEPASQVFYCAKGLRWAIPGERAYTKSRLRHDPLSQKKRLRLISVTIRPLNHANVMSVH